MENKHNNKNYWWSHGYDTSDPYILETWSRKMFGHKKEATRCDPMGGSQKSKSIVWNKLQKRGGIDDHKHISLYINGKSYNGF